MGYDKGRNKADDVRKVTTASAKSSKAGTSDCRVFPHTCPAIKSGRTKNMLLKNDRNRGQAGQVPPVRHSQPPCGLESNASVRTSQGLNSPRVTDGNILSLVRSVPSSGIRKTNKTWWKDLRRRLGTHDQPPAARPGRFFCGTHLSDPHGGCNPFVFDINIRVQDVSSGKLRKVMKRVLLDTGSDLNLLSAPTHTDLNTRVRPQRCHVRSVGGQSAIVGETQLDWTFIRSNSAKNSDGAVFSDTFFILSRKETPLFDCILGRHWIQGHRSIFLDLWTG